MGLHSDHQTVNYNRQIPVRKEPDVFIAGGGPAGVAAAVAAARAGRRVFLVEPFPALGGAAVNMLVPGFMTFGDGVLSFFCRGGIGIRRRRGQGHGGDALRRLIRRDGGLC